MTASRGKVVIVGPYPPPYGGVSIHIQRMHRHLAQCGTDHQIYSTTGSGGTGTTTAPGTTTSGESRVIPIRTRRWFLRNLWRPTEDVFHFHLVHPVMRILIGVMGWLGKTVVLTIHSENLRHQIQKSRRLKRVAISWSLRQMTRVIVVNPATVELVTSLGVDPGRVVRIPAYLPPLVDPADALEIPDTIWRFIDCHGPIISANAWRIVIQEGVDLYGIDLCIRLCADLRREYPRIGFVFALPKIGDHERFSLLQQELAERQLEDHFIFQTKPAQFYPILMRSDLFLRPTYQDGYGVSIAEALHFAVPAVASDVCQRPAGTVLFANRSFGDLRAKVRAVLADLESHRSRLADQKPPSHGDELMLLYRELLGAKRTGQDHAS